jgi:hypothetical protein
MIILMGFLAIWFSRLDKSDIAEGDLDIAGADLLGEQLRPAHRVLFGGDPLISERVNDGNL